MILAALQVLHLGEPKGGGGVAGHAPVASRREGDASYLRPVGEAGPLELLGEKAAAKDLEPGDHGEPVVFPGEGFRGESA